jgi:hypothetical protein
MSGDNEASFDDEEGDLFPEENPQPFALMTFDCHNEDEDLDAVKDAEDGQIPPSTACLGAVQVVRRRSRLSVSSGLWDRGKKGYLPEEEQVSCDHDEEGKGYLTQDQTLEWGWI